MNFLLHPKSGCHFLNLVMLLFCLIFVAIMRFTDLIPTHMRPFSVNDPSLNNPVKPELLSGSVVLMISLVAPIVCIALSNQPDFPPKDALPYISVVIGNLMTNILTNAFKCALGELRPNFLALCQVNSSMLGGEEYVNSTLSADICTGTAALDGRHSFPSAHCSQVLIIQWLWVSYLFRVSSALYILHVIQYT